MRHLSIEAMTDSRGEFQAHYDRYAEHFTQLVEQGYPGIYTSPAYEITTRRGDILRIEGILLENTDNILGIDKSPEKFPHARWRNVMLVNAFNLERKLVGFRRSNISEEERSDYLYVEGMVASDRSIRGIGPALNIVNEHLMSNVHLFGINDRLLISSGKKMVFRDANAGILEKAQELHELGLVSDEYYLDKVQQRESWEALYAVNGLMGVSEVGNELMKLVFPSNASYPQGGLFRANLTTMEWNGNPRLTLQFSD